VPRSARGTGQIRALSVSSAGETARWGVSDEERLNIC
jgi:hypothetical protein